MDPADLRPRSEGDKFLHVPYEERWERLKPVLIQLYKRMTMRQVADFMKDHYSFHAAVNQLENKFRKWKIRKRTLISEKDDITTALGKRAHPGASTSAVALQQGKPVDNKQLKRYLGDKIRRFQVEPMVPGLFSMWNLPYCAFLASVNQNPDLLSPFGIQGTTLSYIQIKSPEQISPGRQAAGLSPCTQLAWTKANQDRTNLFLQGNYEELFAKCGREARITLSNWLHEFWVHSFVTAKYWGRGTQLWTREMISALTQNALATHRQTPISPPSDVLPDELVSQPTKLCRWVIHVPEMNYESVSESQRQGPDGFKVEDPSSWAPWSENELSSRSFSESMRASITEATFTAPENFPISVELIKESLREDPDALLVDAWKFAIMAGNTELLRPLFENNGFRPPSGIETIHPYHLATSFLDGGNTCCAMISSLCSHLDRAYPIAINNIDNLGHTVFDSMIISVMRSHTNVPPEHVSPSFVHSHRYPGEEKDMCGRWDADSPAVRGLFKRGSCRIPSTWKHPFCHSSVQAVCHSTIAIFGSRASPNINTPSGLFIRHCSNCGMKLKPMPLHALVIMAYYLAERGIPGETLFGAIAILVCLLRLGADVSLTAEVSMEEIIGLSEGMCHHVSILAGELVQAVPQSITARWTPECQIGWRCMRGVFDLARDGKIQRTGGFMIDSLELSQYSTFQNRHIPMDLDFDTNMTSDNTSNHDNIDWSDENEIHSESDCALDYEDLGGHDEWL